MSVASNIQEKLKQTFGDEIQELLAPREGRMFVQVAPPQVKEIIEYLKKNFGLTHLSTISATDVGDNIEVLYHFF